MLQLCLLHVLVVSYNIFEAKFKPFSSLKSDIFFDSRYFDRHLKETDAWWYWTWQNENW